MYQNQIKEAVRPILASISLPEEIETILDRLIANLERTNELGEAYDRIRREEEEFCSRIINHFRWSDSPEGRYFWESLHRKVCDREFDLHEIKTAELKDIAVNNPSLVYDENGKTILEWINTLPNPQRNQLYVCYLEKEKAHRLIIARYEANGENCDHYTTIWNVKGNYITALEERLDLAHTTQGIRYWRNFFRDFSRIETYIREAEEEKKEAERQIRREEERARIEANKLSFSKSFREMLDNIKNVSKVAEILRLDGYQTREFGNYITMRGEMATYLPNGREHKTNDNGTWVRAGRQEARIGKLARKLINADGLNMLTDADFEKFANSVKSYISVIGDEDGEGKK